MDESYFIISSGTEDDIIAKHKEMIMNKLSDDIDEITHASKLIKMLEEELKSLKKILYSIIKINGINGIIEIPDSIIVKISEYESEFEI